MGGDLLFTACAGILSTVTACLMLPSRRRFFGGDIDQECVNRSVPLFRLVFARQELNPNSDICVPEDFENARLDYVGSGDQKIPRLRLEQWHALMVMPLTRAFTFTWCTFSAHDT